MMSVLLLVACCASAVCGQDVESWVSDVMKRYPQARLLDIYKSCFQDYMGAEHLVGNAEAARTYLEQELETTVIEDLQPWYYEPCGFNGNYVRVSLLAVKAGIISSDVLLDAFVRSANDPDRPSDPAGDLRRGDFSLYHRHGRLYDPAGKRQDQGY